MLSTFHFIFDLLHKKAIKYFSCCLIKTKNQNSDVITNYATTVLCIIVTLKYISTDNSLRLLIKCKCIFLKLVSSRKKII